MARRFTPTQTNGQCSALKDNPNKTRKLATRIEQLILSSGTDVASFLHTAGLNTSVIEEIRRNNTMPSEETLSRIAKALDLNLSALLNEGTDEKSSKKLQGLPVLGVAAVGQFRNTKLNDPHRIDERIGIGTDPRYPNATQYAIKLADGSMDNIFPRNSYACCVDYKDSGLDLKDGMIVHLERRPRQAAPDNETVETSIRQVCTTGDKLQFKCSSQSEVHPPVAEDDEQYDIEVRGVVTGSYTPMAV